MANWQLSKIAVIPNDDPNNLKLKFLNLAISLEPYGVNYRLLDLTEFIVGNMKGLRHRVEKK